MDMPAYVQSHLMHNKCVPQNVFAFQLRLPISLKTRPIQAPKTSFY